MERNQGRRMSAEEKLRVVAVGRQSGATVSERGSWFTATSALLGKGNSGQLLPGEGR